jgi:hypothetical protein
MGTLLHRQFSNGAQKYSFLYDRPNKKRLKMED